MKQIVLALASVLLVEAASSQSNIRAIAIVTRHGDRTPRGTYPGDPFPNLFDESEYGKLTPTGCTRMYLNGKFLRGNFPQLKSRSASPCSFSGLIIDLR